jgi:hypothetical protein
MKPNTYASHIGLDYISISSAFTLFTTLVYPAGICLPYAPAPAEFKGGNEPPL